MTIEINKDEQITREVLLNFQKIQQHITTPISCMNETIVYSVIKTVDKSEVDYNAMIQNLGGPETPKDIISIVEDILSELVEGLRLLSKLVQAKVYVATSYQRLIATMINIETKFVLQKIKKEDTETTIDEMVETLNMRF